MFRFLRVVLLPISIVLAAGCNSSNPTLSPTTPTTPTSTTDTFSGTLNPNGAATYPFAVPAAGVVTATLTSITPDSALVIGLSLGTWNGSACQIVLANDKATQGTVVIGSVSGAGNLCVRVYDVGSVVSAESFQVVVVHP